MNIVLVGLMRAAGAWLALTTAMTWLLHHLTGAPAIDSLALGLLAGGAALPAFGLLFSSGKRWRELGTMRAGTQGKPPVDGSKVVLVGVIQATGPLLTAPMDRTPCVTYAYDIKVYRGSGKWRMLHKVARGVALTPSVIATPAGRFKLLVVPDLRATATSASQMQCIDNFVTYAGRTSFIEAKSSAQELSDRWSDDDGAYRSDVAFEPLIGANTHGWIVQQQHVAPGAQVCVIGRFNRERGGVVPSADNTPTRLFVGNAAVVAADLRQTALWHAGFGILLAAAPAYLVWSAWQALIPEF